MELTLPRVLWSAAEDFGDDLAYVDDLESLSFTDLLTRVRRTAAGYRRLGVEPGDACLIWAPNSIDWAVAALAVSYCGGTLVPANSRYTGYEVAELVARTRARLTVVADGFLGRQQVHELTAAGLGDAHGSVVDIAALRDVESEPADVDDIAAAVRPDEVADILFTSGTTGRSKGAMSSHRQTIGVANAWAELACLSPDDRYLGVNPFFHAFGYKIGLVASLIAGATLYPVSTFDVEECMKLIETERITVFPGAPTLFQSILNARGRATRDLSSLRLAVTGASIVPVVLIERMREPPPAGLGIDQVATAFGMTEAVVVTMCRAGDSAETVAKTNGRAVPGMEVRIDTGGRADTGTTGELLVRGDYVMLGYLDDPVATCSAIDDDGWLHTGDVGSIDDDGNLRITDRLGDMYITGGFNVYPAEVEQLLARMPGIADVAVVGVPDERLGEVGVAHVVRAEGASLTQEDVIAFARERLANFKVPRRVTFSDALPHNLSGKVLKRELRSASTEAS